MVKEIYLDNAPCTLQIVIQTRAKEKLWIKVANADKKNTYYTKRYARFKGVQSFFVRMPQAPNRAYIVIYNDKDKNPRQKDKSFKIRGINILPLEDNASAIPKKSMAFIRFAQEFSQECGTLRASKKGVVYKSNNGKFRIDYFDTIRSKSGGKEVKTPARISQLTGRIEVSKKSFKGYSIPMRIAILLHEYSHFYVNKNPSSELQSDENGLKMYLSMGYPRIDAYNVFLNVFKNSSSSQNLQRYEQLDKMIKNWEYGK